jgi:hypothetical protein
MLEIRDNDSLQTGNYEEMCVKTQYCVYEQTTVHILTGLLCTRKVIYVTLLHSSITSKTTSA